MSSTVRTLRLHPGQATSERDARQLRHDSINLPRTRLRRVARAAVAWAIRLIAGVSLVAIAVIWLHGGGITGIGSLGAALTSAGRLTGLLGAYSLLAQLLLMARIPFLEWVASFDRLAVWHKLNGKLAISLILAHVGLITTGYALTGKLTLTAQFAAFLAGYPGMVAALAATVLLVLVAVTSAVIVKRRLGYQTWFLVHLMSYSAVALAWFHQIPAGTVFLGLPLGAAFWTALFVGTLQLVILFRFATPIVRNLWFGLHVEEVMQEGPGVVSLRITGRHLAWLHARAGQYFLWRFLDGERWQEAHPFSLSAAPDGRSLRITVKDLGDFSKHLDEITQGTRVFVEGPFGSFTTDARSRDQVLMVAGGVGITPIRALLEEMSGDVTLIYRASRDADLIFRDELDQLASERGVTIHYITSDRIMGRRDDYLSAAHLADLVPDIKQREVYLCGPDGMMRAVRAAVRRIGVPAKHIHIDQFAF